MENIIQRLAFEAKASLQDGGELFEEPKVMLRRFETLIQNKHYRLYTRKSRDWSKSANGGDYAFWTDFTVTGDNVIVSWHCGADIPVDCGENEIWEGVAEQFTWQWIIVQMTFL